MSRTEVDYLIILQRAIDGCSFTGVPGNHRPIRFFRDPAIVGLMQFPTMILVRTINRALTDRQEIDTFSMVMLRKLLLHVIRQGPAYAHSVALITDVEAVARTVRHLPETVTNPASYTWYLEMDRLISPVSPLASYTHLDAIAKLKSIHQENPADLPHPAVVWSNGDSTLVSLTEPLQIFDEGVHFGNCLATHFLKPLSLGTLQYPQALEGLAYVHVIRQGTLALYSLRRGPQRLGCFSIKDRRIKELAAASGISPADSFLLNNLATYARFDALDRTAL